MNKENSLPKNEIDVILQLFKHYKKMILGITFLFTLCAALYAITIHKPIYRAIALIQIGKKNNILVDTSKIFQLKFINQYKVNNVPPEPLPRISKVKIIDDRIGIIRLYAQSYNLENLEGYLKKVVKNITNEHNETIQEYIKEYNNSLTLAQTNLTQNKITLAHIQENIKENEKKIKALTNDDQALINMYLFKMLRDDMSIEPLSRKITTYTNQVRTYTRLLSKKKTFGTHMINQVITFQKPITISKTMLVFIGSVIGLIFSLLLAFFLGFLKERQK